MEGTRWSEVSGRQSTGRGVASRKHRPRPSIAGRVASGKLQGHVADSTAEWRPLRRSGYGIAQAGRQSAVAVPNSLLSIMTPWRRKRASNQSPDTGLLNRKPCISSQRSSRSRFDCSWVSMPSATTVILSACAKYRWEDRIRLNRAATKRSPPIPGADGSQESPHAGLAPVRFGAVPRPSACRCDAAHLPGPARQ